MDFCRVNGTRILNPVVIKSKYILFNSIIQEYVNDFLSAFYLALV